MTTTLELDDQNTALELPVLSPGSTAEVTFAAAGPSDTPMDVRSDSANLYVRISRRIEQNGRLVRTKTWNDVIPRGIN